MSPVSDHEIPSQTAISYTWWLATSLMLYISPSPLPKTMAFIYLMSSSGTICRGARWQWNDQWVTHEESQLPRVGQSMAVGQYNGTVYLLYVMLCIMV